MVSFLKLGRYIVKLLGFLHSKVRAAFAGWFGTIISDTDFQKSLVPELAQLDDFLYRFAEHGSKSFFISPLRKNEYIDSLHKLCPGAPERIIQAADAVCGHQFDLLGSGPVDLGWPIDWHSDFKTGHRWNPRQYYTDVRPASYPGGYDLKVPWELSRCQHFVWLGQAYWLTGDEKYAGEFRLEVEDWIEQNVPEFGVNWACSMDIAIRAVNWLWGYAFFLASPSLDDRFRIEFCKSLLAHGRHIMANLEWSPVFTGNHYLSDIVGLVYLGILMPEFRESQTWREFGLKELENEMFRQVYADGGDFEASTSYHRLVTELFVSATSLAQINGHTFTQPFMDRLEKMLDLIYQITKPDGTVPIIGDQDNGRLHRLKVWADPSREWTDFRPLLAIGCELFNRLDWGKIASSHWDEAIWFFGDRSVKAHQQSTSHPAASLRSIGFKETGLYVMRADDIYVTVDLGSVGQNGTGGHAHNDTLSFELFAAGQTWIEDPGTYVYTSDYEARNQFRSTEFHNGIDFAGYEQNRFAKLTLFSLENESVSSLLAWDSDSGLNVHLAGELQRTKDPKLTHRRSFFLDRVQRTLVIADWVRDLNFTWRSVLHLAPGLHIGLLEAPYRGIRLMGSTQKSVWIYSTSSTSIKPDILDGWVSHSYGKRQTSSIVCFESAEAQHEIVIILPGEEHNIPTRMNQALANARNFWNKYQLSTT